MRAIAATLLLASAGLAQADFKASAPIELKGSDAFHRLTLPMEVYRDARPDLADVRVLNARGEAVPFAFAPEPDPVKEAPTSAPLPQFPVAPRPAGVTGTSRVQVSVTTRADGTLVSVQERTTGKQVLPRPVAYLLDASQLESPVGALIFDWEAAAGAQLVKVTVEGSDDLRDWRTLASRAPLVRLEQAGQSLSQVRVEMRGAKVKYYRITWDAAPFVLKSVQAESVPAVKPRERRVARYRAVESKDGEFVYDLGARLPVEMVKVVFPEPNSIAAYDFAVRDAAKDPWRNVAAATFHRIVRDGVELTSTPLSVGRRTERFWKLAARNKGGDPAPELEVHWRPAEIVFVAKGEGPFTLAFADPQSKNAALAISNLIPNYERGTEAKLPQAFPGDVRGAPPPTAMESLLGDVSPKRVALWAVLALGVVILGFMAWSLQRQMKAK